MVAGVESDEGSCSGGMVVDELHDGELVVVEVAVDAVLMHLDLDVLGVGEEDFVVVQGFLGDVEDVDVLDGI